MSKAKAASHEMPTVGRIVHFRQDTEQPLPILSAIVAGVNEDQTVNLAVFDQNGEIMHGGRQSVPFFDGDEDDRPTDGCYAEWPPRV